MNKSMNKVIAASVLAALLGSGAALAEMSANIGATSNYVWRGITQTNDGAAVSGGLDYSHGSGIYIGTWTSNTAWTNANTGAATAEVDLYGGYAKEFGELSVDLGVVRYAYPTANMLNWTEYKLEVGYGPATLALGKGQNVFGNQDVDSTYAALDLTHDIKEDLSVGLHVGSWKFTEALDNGWVGPAGAGFDDSFMEYGASVTKGDFTFTVSDTNLDKDVYTNDGQYRLYASYTKEFDL